MLTSQVGDAIAYQRTQLLVEELSTPVLMPRDRLLLVPLIGSISDRRAQQLRDQLLRAIRAERARAVVIDLTGVASIDQTVADRLVNTIEAVRLLGAETIVSGISARSSRALVGLGVDLSRLRTVADLRTGLEEAERLRGLRIGGEASAAREPSPPGE